MSNPNWSDKIGGNPPAPPTAPLLEEEGGQGTAWRTRSKPLVMLKIERRKHADLYLPYNEVRSIQSAESAIVIRFEEVTVTLEGRHLDALAELLSERLVKRVIEQHIPSDTAAADTSYIDKVSLSDVVLGQWWG